MEGAKTARNMWRLIEPIHAVTYFALEPRASLSEVGLKGFWMGYFAGRSAPMGAVGPAVVTATFFNFAPGMVRRSVPDAWKFASPSEVLDARLVGAERALRALLGPQPDSGDMTSADLLRRAAESVSFAGRPLGAANASLAWPSDALLVLWQAATVLREHRGDGHNSALCVAGLDGCQAHVSLVATGAVSRSTLQPNRGWSDDEWDGAEGSMIERGWIDEARAETTNGSAERRQIEKTTDRLAAEPWELLGEEACDRLAGLLRPMASVISSSGVLQQPNPMGLPPPA